jgi:hypothetical protein
VPCAHVQEKRSAYAPTLETPVRYDGIYRIVRCWRTKGAQVGGGVGMQGQAGYGRGAQGRDAGWANRAGMGLFCSLVHALLS